MKIEPKSLRIGNLFREKHTGSHVSIIGLTATRITFSGKFYNEWQAEPIKINGMWLEKFGFKLEVINEDERPVYILNMDEYFYIDFDTLQPMDAGYPIAKVKIEYVHQLQNLYFDLTGQELTIK